MGLDLFVSNSKGQPRRSKSFLSCSSCSLVLLVLLACFARPARLFCSSCSLVLLVLRACSARPARLFCSSCALVLLILRACSARPARLFCSSCALVLLVLLACPARSARLSCSSQKSIKSQYSYTKAPGFHHSEFRQNSFASMIVLETFHQSYRMRGYISSVNGANNNRSISQIYGKYRPAL
jgi:hypothetical protein